MLDHWLDIYSYIEAAVTSLADASRSDQLVAADGYILINVKHLPV